MMSDSIKLSVTLSATPRVVYEAWLDSEKHSEFTGSKAEIQRKVGTNFTAEDGYIQGMNLTLYRFKKIIQTWRTTDFPEGSEDSNLEVNLDLVKNGTKLTIIHTNLPEGDGLKYRKTWRENYFTPMKEYFKKLE